MRREDTVPGFFATSKLALVVNRDVTLLTALQHALTLKGYKVLVARDLPTALLTITQHHLDAAIVASSLSENGDGFPLAGIIQRIFPHALVSVLAGDENVQTLLAAINHGVRTVVGSQSGDVEYLVRAALRQASSGQE